MALSCEEVFKMLREKQVAYRMVAHPAVFTMEEMEALKLREKTAAIASVTTRNGITIFSASKGRSASTRKGSDRSCKAGH